MLPSRRVVVTGVGLVTPLGVGVEQSWRRLLAGETAVRRLPSLDGLPAQIAAPVPREGEGGFSLAGCGLAAPGDETSLSTFVQFALAAADEALVQARWSPETRAEQERTGVAIGSGIGGLSDIVEASDALRERGARRVSPFFIPRMLVNMAAGQVSIRAGLRGPSAAPATACATGAHALADGLGMIRSGEADVVVAGGAEACIEPLAVAGFARARALATSYNDAAAAPGASRPFDAERAGFVIGEGAAVMVLEEEGHARRRGATPLAELRAVGLSSDAHHITAPPDRLPGPGLDRISTPSGPTRLSRLPLPVISATSRLRLFSAHSRRTSHRLGSTTSRCRRTTSPRIESE
uniref:beta-ketoacyl-[acyl-carrier-protein] synthase I n=1 Tax=Emiliania huxleyi TaxID=2903 RepID=A0A7S3W9N4_EMIHU